MGFSDWLCFDDGLGDASLTNNVTFFLEFGDVISLGGKARRKLLNQKRAVRKRNFSERKPN